MPTVYEAKLNEDGTLDARDALPVGSRRRVLITVLDEAPPASDDPDLIAWQKLSIRSVFNEVEDGEDYSTWEPLEVVKARHRHKPREQQNG
jgi:hypothetical protein